MIELLENDSRLYPTPNTSIYIVMNGQIIKRGNKEWYIRNEMYKQIHKYMINGIHATLLYLFFADTLMSDWLHKDCPNETLKLEIHIPTEFRISVVTSNDLFIFPHSWGGIILLFTISDEFGHDAVLLKLSSFLVALQ